MEPTEKSLEMLLGYRITRVERLKPGALGKVSEDGGTISLKLEAPGRVSLMALIVDGFMTLWSPPATFGPEWIELHFELSVIDYLAELG